MYGSSEVRESPSNKLQSSPTSHIALLVTHVIFPFVRLVCTPNDACNRDVRKVQVACANAAGSSGTLSVACYTDRGAGDLHAAPNYLPSKLARACGYSAARGFLEGMA